MGTLEMVGVNPAVNDGGTVYNDVTIRVRVCKGRHVTVTLSSVQPCAVVSWFHRRALCPRPSSNTTNLSLVSCGMLEKPRLCDMLRVCLCSDQRIHPGGYPVAYPAVT